MRKILWGFWVLSAVVMFSGCNGVAGTTQESDVSTGIDWELTEQISDEELEELLKGKGVQTEEGYITYRGMNSAYVVVAHDFQKENLKDVVTVEIRAAIEFKRIVATVEHILHYNSENKCWEMQESELVSVETSYIEGYDVRLPEEQVLEDAFYITDNPLITGYHYRLTGNDTTLTDIRMGENAYDGEYMTVPIRFTVNHKDVSFDMYYNVEYYFDTKECKWIFRRGGTWGVENENNNVIGVWAGTMGDDQVVITVKNTRHAIRVHFLDVVVEVVTKKGVTYSYSGYLYEYNPRSGYVLICAHGAIDNVPAGRELKDIEAYCADGVLTPCNKKDKFRFEKEK